MTRDELKGRIEAIERELPSLWAAYRELREHAVELLIKADMSLGPLPTETSDGRPIRGAILSLPDEFTGPRKPRPLGQQCEHGWIPGNCPECLP